MAKESKSDEPLKVTDKRIFTADGELKEEFRETVKPADPASAVNRPPAEPPPAPPEPKREQPPAADNRRRARGEMPDTPFATLVQMLGLNAYMSLGLTGNPTGQRGPVDLVGAQQMIDMLSMLQEKTKGNLTEEETDFLSTFVGELKLAFVRIKGL